MGAEPFYDLEQHALLGVANLFLECLHHSVPHDYPAPIIAPTGVVRGGEEGLCESRIMILSVVGMWKASCHCAEGSTGRRG